MKRFHFPLSLVLSLSALFGASAHAAEPVLVSGGQVQITAADLKADALRMPPEMRPLVLAETKSVTQIASNLFARRALAQRAKAEGLDKDPVLQAALQVALDKVLSDAMLAEIDARAMPPEPAVQGLARNIYTAKPERFKAPERVEASHILFKEDQPDALAQAEKTLEELKQGADFAKLASERSQDKASAAKGGSLGVFGKGQMVPEFEEAVFKLERSGDLSPVVKSKFGYHIIRLNARKPAGQQTFDEVREDLVKEVRNNLLQEARAAEAAKMQQQAQFDNEAIQAFSAGYAKDTKKRP
ncbi:MAG: peptidylprolyl isomerase [Burkholderiales bacterium RIFCSPLOWO2_12_FULL_65_40]|nr:MAG: peptidylprolyl isomerase [Burkholderiales bacterium RIFCSPLOWO2_12_FULL_65_40]